MSAKKHLLRAKRLHLADARSNFKNKKAPGMDNFKIEIVGEL